MVQIHVVTTAYQYRRHFQLPWRPWTRFRGHANIRRSQ